MIHFNQATVADRQLEYVREAFETHHVSGDGPFCRAAERILETGVGAKRALLTTSCTHALEMSALLLDLRPGDEVIVPAFTFVSTINAFALRGATPVFCDVRQDTLNLDEALLESKITARTRAIVPVHYAGVACEMNAILPLAESRNIAVVEDNAHGLFGSYHGRPLGSFGALATQSFHETKNFSCGEGGALLVNDERFIERAEILREKGTNRSRFFRGQVDKYTWVDLGSSWVLSDVLGAVLRAQLEARESIQRRREAVWRRYAAGLGDWARARGVGLPSVPPHCEQSFHMFYLVLADLAERTAFIEHLGKAGMKAVFHYQPLHLSPMGRELGTAREGDCPVTERIADCLVRLPFYADLTESEQDRIIETACAFG
ncbi:MAG: dTDP-4-amino-4,6-dideoxygalactose transaminase [Labilithrix sp.]|nr:dTDP-4-amino-4,6-dideoxygalactose transaminase [Labilithrix sp.]MBX3220855.1 dTDP-4-amino-4,6-dideoxygalactose transaminase [Labilithrix sp.]